MLKPMARSSKKIVTKNYFKTVPTHELVVPIETPEGTVEAVLQVKDKAVDVKFMRKFKPAVAAISKAESSDGLEAILLGYDLGLEILATCVASWNLDVALDTEDLKNLEPDFAEPILAALLKDLGLSGADNGDGDEATLSPN